MITPEVEIDSAELEEFESISNTYEIDFANKRLTGKMIDGLNAIRQFVHLAIQISRFKYPIYSDDYGSELFDLITDEEATEELIENEIPRLISEAIEFDDRIESVDHFFIEKIEDAYFISFDVTTTEGVIEVQEVI
ncbi:DUF2634 domain-containing protein [Listeria seeligeri]|uniref:DUF2634 domain-containing protein n=1 Tax=Listeria seeligeri TaxID=1640 RepID=UPI00139C68DA|nr:DUF2634 domain-containing protein [Listeria seeligeri]EDP7604040.1 DUF2634 domain-containing protein [Listeria monocytogenes]EEO0668507.1 DUF2634 domain-containing protein [Listeria monocytogenes]EEO9123613.1 DUF2634 domain-containing protein [Listeria monocytogenes]MBC2030647.1 DUF2634 domain-containing protein [Listeria seeligeri]MBC6115131.1 DUF2634 domain-containing protein [Listeria seeligeri]